MRTLTATTFHWFSHVSSSRISLVITSWRAEKQKQQQQEWEVKSNKIKEVSAVIMMIILQGGNEKVIAVVLRAALRSMWVVNGVQMKQCRWRSAQCTQPSHSVLQVQPQGQSRKCSILVRVRRWRFTVQSIVQCSSFRDGVLAGVNECTYMQCVVFSLPWLKCNSQVLGSVPMLCLFLGAKSGHPEK